MGAHGLTEAHAVAILNANYMAKRLAELLPGPLPRPRRPGGPRVHPRPAPVQEHVTVEDVAKRLMDYGFHAPTISWPVPGTMMVEPTESESKAELDRFCEAMITIRAEIRAIESGKADQHNNPLKNAPHTAAGRVPPTPGAIPTPARRRLIPRRGCTTTSSGPPWAASTTPSATAIWCAPAPAWKPMPDKNAPKAGQQPAPLNTQRPGCLGLVGRDGGFGLFCLGHRAILGLGNGLLLRFNRAVAAGAAALGLGNLFVAPDQQTNNAKADVATHITAIPLLIVCFMGDKIPDGWISTTGGFPR